MVERVLRVSLHLDELSVVVGVEQDSATLMAAGTGPCAAACHGVVVLLVLPRLLVLDKSVILLSHALLLPLFSACGATPIG